MALIKEDGTGKADANSYASVAEGDAYHEGHLYATAWTAATQANKEKALVFATRLIDAEFRFKGVKASTTQALQWPRAECRDSDGADDLASDAVPSAVVNATCEMARELLVKDRTAAYPGEGLKYQNVGSAQTGYDKTDTPPVITRVAQAMLAKLGALLKAKSGAVNLIRV
jgi:hypothetical protein